MGISYGAYYGIGVKVIEPSFTNKKLLPQHFSECDDMDEYCDIICRMGVGHKYFTIGNEGDYTYHVYIDNPFIDGGNKLIEKIYYLKMTLINLGVEYYDDVDVVGGLLIS